MTVEELYTSIHANYKEAKSRLMNDKLITKFIVKFLNDPSFDQLMEAKKNEDAEGMFHASHSLKGVAGNLALTSLQNLASDICESFRPGKEVPHSKEELESMFSELDSLYKDTCQKIEEFSK